MNNPLILVIKFTVMAMITRQAEMDLMNLQSEQHYTLMRAYSRSELANILFRPLMLDISLYS